MILITIGLLIMIFGVFAGIIGVNTLLKSKSPTIQNFPKQEVKNPYIEQHKKKNELIEEVRKSNIKIREEQQRMAHKYKEYLKWCKENNTEPTINADYSDEIMHYLLD